MSIIILILKIIGIILLLLLAFIIVIGISVLLVPARYEVKGSFNSENKAFFLRVTWLLRAVSLLIYSGESGIEKKITIFGFRLKEKKKDKTNIKNNDKSDIGGEDAWQAAVAQKRKEDVGQDKEATKTSHKDNGRLSDDKEASNRRGLFGKLADKIKGIIQKIKDIYNKICDTIKKTRDFTSKVKEFISDATNKVVFGRVKKEAFYLLKHFKPRKIEGKLLFGTGDPATTGWILGGFYALYQGFPGRIDVTCDFNEKVMEGDVTIKGRVRGIHGLLVVIRLFGNRDFRRMLNFRKKFMKQTNI